MPAQAPPAGPGKRIYGICQRPLNNYNKSDICQWHKPEDVKKYRDAQWEHGRNSRELQAFVRAFHKEGTVKEMFAEATKAESKPRLQMAATELKQYHEALGLLKAASMVFRLSMPSILRIHALQKKNKIAREVMMYVMQKDLGMSVEEIAVFFGYKHPPNVGESIKGMAQAYFEDEDVILAIDLVREDFHRLNQSE